MAYLMAILVRFFLTIALRVMVKRNIHAEEAKWLLHYLRGSGEAKQIPQEWGTRILSAVEEYGWENLYCTSSPLGEDKWLVPGALFEGHPIAKTLGSFWVVETPNGLLVEDYYDWHPGHGCPPSWGLNGYWDTSGYWVIEAPVAVGWLFGAIGLGCILDGKGWVSEATFALAAKGGAEPFFTYGYL